MRYVAKFAIVLSLLALTSCATIIEHDYDHISIATSPAAHANCTLGNSRETVTGVAPSTVTVKKSINDLTVSCADPTTGATGQTQVRSLIEPWDFANVLTLGVGMGVDWLTGAAYNYPDTALVPLTAPATYTVTPYQAPAPTASPAYRAPTPVPYPAYESPAPAALPTTR